MKYKNPVTLEEMHDRLTYGQLAEQDIADRALAMLADHRTALETFAVAIAAELMPLPDLSSPYLTDKQRRDRAALDLGIFQAVLKLSSQRHRRSNRSNSPLYRFPVADSSRTDGTIAPQHPHSRNRPEMIAAGIESGRS
jgi:hypothetical protein